MATATFSKFDILTLDLANGVHNLGSDNIKLALFNSLPAVTSTSYDVVKSSNEISTAGGYTLGGNSIPSLTITQPTAGTAQFTGGNVVFSATGTMDQFQYVVMYNSTSAGTELIGWYDYGAGIILSDTETFTVNIVTSIFTIS